MKNTIPYAPEDWTTDQLAFHRADNLEAALHSACCLAGGWYRRPVTVDSQITEDNDEQYMLRPADVAPLDGWTACYTITAESRTS
jgi:hypothetical protein